MNQNSKTTSVKKDGKTTLMPKLRFPEFRDAEGWESKSMSEVYAFKGHNSLSRDKLNYERGSVKNIHYGDIHTKFSTHFDIAKETVPYINQSESLKAFEAENFCVEGDIIFADASEDLEDIGKAIEIVSLNGERVLSGLHTILARQTETDLVRGFGGHLFKSKRVRTLIQKESQGSKVLGLSGGRLAKIEIPFPSSPREQQKIAECLSSVDEVIAAEARKLDALKSHKKGLMQELFPREGETQPRLRFPQFQDAPEWSGDSLGQIFKTSSGGTPSRSKEEYWNGNIPWITTSLVDFNVITKADEFISDEGLKNSSAKVFPEKTILVAMYGQGKTRGQVAILGIKAATNQACAAILPRKNMDPNFVFMNLASRYEEMRGLSNSGGQKNLSQGLIQELQFSYPNDIDEQQVIAECLTFLDDLIVAQAQKLEALKAHKKGLMQQLFPSPESNL
jgi:type I restriction enzyme S subunit